MHPVVDKLVHLIETHGWRASFEEAIANIAGLDLPELAALKSVDDYLRYVDDFVCWAPRSPGDSNQIYRRMVEFYFILDQEPIRKLKNPIVPDQAGRPPTPLSAWITEFAHAWGAYLDTPESAKEVESFRTAPDFNWDEYLPPPSGYLTFNQFMARHVKPGLRPVAALGDPTVLVSPTDSNFVGWWQIDDASRIFVTTKGLRWSIQQLLEGSPYADRFRNGIFTHSSLGTFDYHRWHTPVPGKVVEARVIQGLAVLDVATVPGVVDGRHVSVLNALDETGYQFVQTRGLVVIESPIGLVACLPIGMAQVSSVVITAEVSRTLRKGEELGYFAFGGSDFVIVFEQQSNVLLTAQAGVHSRQGMPIGKAYPP